MRSTPRIRNSAAAATAATAMLAISIAACAPVASGAPASHDAPAGHTVPPYYASLTFVRQRRILAALGVTIRATGTGKVLATGPSAPAGYWFAQVSAAADDRTFVVAAVPEGHVNWPERRFRRPVRLYLLRFNSGRGTVTSTRLPIGNVTSNGCPIGIALSPDGKYLAAVSSAYDGLRVYSVRTGAERTWRTPRLGSVTGPAWAGNNRTLAFYWHPLAPGDRRGGLYLLDTASSRRGLLPASHRILTQTQTRCITNYFLPRPSKIVCTRYRASAAAIIEASLRTRTWVRRIWLPTDVQARAGDPGDPPEIAWANRAGTKVIVLAGKAKPRPYGQVRAVLVTPGRITRLPGATWHGEMGYVVPAAW